MSSIRTFSLNNRLALMQRHCGLFCTKCNSRSGFRTLVPSKAQQEVPTKAQQDISFPENKRLLLRLSTNNSSRIRFSSSQGTSQKPPLINITPISVLISVLLSAGVYAVYLWLEDGKQLLKSKQRIEALSETGLGTLNWSLTDQYGKRREFLEFRGQWLMLYFGFCHCPDICPEELEKLTNVVKRIDANPKTPDIQPVFITLDPERDTVPYLNKYCKDFSKLIGFTGSTEEIAEVAKSYRVYFNLGAKDTDGDYIVDHTICMYLINPKGQVMDVYQRRANVEGIINGSLKHISDYSKLKNG